MGCKAGAAAMTINPNPNRDPEAQATPSSQPPPSARLARDNTHQLITEIAKALVDSPDEVFVEAVERDENTVLRLHVSQPDIGKVIGKQGRTAHSMRTILSAVSMKYHHRYTLDIVERDVDPSTGPKHHDA
jgi:predicted RNA-binding protein YlqC (UPF0109 family)